MANNPWLILRLYVASPPADPDQSTRFVSTEIAKLLVVGA